MIASAVGWARYECDAADEGRCHTVEVSPCRLRAGLPSTAVGAGHARRCRRPSEEKGWGGERGTGLPAMADHAMPQCGSALPHAVPRRVIVGGAHCPRRRAPTSTVVSVTQLDLDSTYPSRRRELDGPLAARNCLKTQIGDQLNVAEQHIVKILELEPAESPTYSLT